MLALELLSVGLRPIKVTIDQTASNRGGDQPKRKTEMGPKSEVLVAGAAVSFAAVKCDEVQDATKSTHFIKLPTAASTVGQLFGRRMPPGPVASQGQSASYLELVANA